MGMNSVLPELILEILIINTSFLHLLLCQQVKHGIASVSTADKLAIRAIHWIWTHANVGVWKFHLAKGLQKVAVTSFSCSVNNEHLLGVPLLIVVGVLAIVVRWIDKTNGSRQVSLCESTSRHVSTFSESVVVLKTEMMVNDTLSLLFQSDGCLEWHDSFPIFFI